MLCLSVFVIVIDGTIVNVALPTMVRELGATTSQLQWIVDAYTLVFAGLLLAAGSLGDRYGRKPALAHRPGLVRRHLAAGRLLAVARAADRRPGGHGRRRRADLPGHAGHPQQRLPRAVASGPRPSASGPRSAASRWRSVRSRGGWLLEHFWWGSVFLVNIPIVIFALVVGWFLIPNSRDPHAQRLDPLGLVLSIAGVTLLVWAVIEAPGTGWTSPTILAAFAVAFALIGGFLWWELHTDAPMLDVRIFTNLRFSAGSLSITVAFFALFGFVFTVTQYFQAVRGYSTLEAGVRTLPFAVATGIASPLAPKAGAAVRHQGGGGLGPHVDGHRHVHRQHVDGDVELPGHRGVDGVHGQRPRLRHRTGDRVDHGRPAPGAGRRRLGRQRHHPRAGRHARRGHRRQPGGLDLQRPGRRRAGRHAGAARGARRGQGLGHRRPLRGRGGDRTGSARPPATSSGASPAGPTSTASSSAPGSWARSPSSGRSPPSCGCRPEPRSSRPTEVTDLDEARRSSSSSTTSTCRTSSTVCHLDRSS